MKILFLGGDKRQLEIIKHLANKGHEIDALGYEQSQIDETIRKVSLHDINIKTYNVVIFPVSGVKDDFSVVSDFTNEKILLNDHFLDGIEQRALIFTGIMTNALDQMLKNAKKDAIALMQDNEVKKDNSIPTAEGIIGDLVFNTDYTINGANIFILGYGNVGKTLAEKLKALGASLTVGVIAVDEFDSLAKNNINCLYTNNRLLMEGVMQDSDVIINTVPDLIINKEYLRVMNKDIYILDISSYPHGVDFKAANEMQIKNKLLLGIPSLVAPKTAGQILVNKIDSIIERSKQ